MKDAQATVAAAWIAAGAALLGVIVTSASGLQLQRDATEENRRVVATQIAASFAQARLEATASMNLLSHGATQEAQTTRARLVLSRLVPADTPAADRVLHMFRAKNESEVSARDVQAEVMMPAPIIRESIASEPRSFTKVDVPVPGSATIYLGDLHPGASVLFRFAVEGIGSPSTSGAEVIQLTCDNCLAGAAVEPIHTATTMATPVLHTALPPQTATATPEASATQSLLQTPTVVPPPRSCRIYHTVRPGETTYTIAMQYDSTVNAIMAANGLSNPNWLYVGQSLCIP